MGVFRDFLEREYTTDPAGSARFLSDSCVLVRIRRRYWKGLKRMDKARVMSDDVVVGEDSTTRPSWKLCPDVMRAEFEALGVQVEALVIRYALNRGSTTPVDADEDEAGPALVGGGTYAIDAGVWPGLYDKLRIAQEKWSDASHRWCSEDGYRRIHDELKTQLGDGDYALVKDLVPKADSLLRKFGLDVRRAPVRFIEDAQGDPGLAQSMQADIVEMLDMAVRPPREAAAVAWTALASRLIDSMGQAVKPLGKPDPTTGQAVPGLRKLTGRSVAAAGREAATLATKSWAWLEDSFRGVVQALINELPESPTDATAIAKNLNSKDEEAVRLGKMLVAAATQARDEAGMCEGFAAARNR